VISSAEHIVRSARNLDRMIADLSDFSVLEAKSLKLVCRACDVPKMAREAVERIRAASDRAIVLHCSGEWVIEADDGRLNQVFDNLLSNAVKYGDPQSPIDVLISEGDDAVEVTVTNRGVGISASELPFLFKSRLGNRVLRPGLGLSLYICKGLVEAHGGSIRADSTPGQRTAIKLSLPLRAAVQSARAAQTG
jgi:signal transduction histidine kinase